MEFSVSQDALEYVHFITNTIEEYPSFSKIEEVEALKSKLHPILVQALSDIFSYMKDPYHQFSTPLSHIGISSFYNKIYEVLQLEITAGKTCTYGELAALAGSPKASRAVGTAMRKNQHPIFIPCHRVLSAKGIGGYAFGLDMKISLLNHEEVLKF